jgi:hypothetical protein
MTIVVNKVGRMSPSSSSLTSPTTRRQLLGAAAAAAAVALTLGAASPAAAGERVANPAAGAGTFLVAADPAAEALHVYRVSDLRRTGSLEQIEVDTHAGTVALPDGRVLLVSEDAKVHTVRISAAGRPTVERTVAIPSANREWAGAAWAAIDPSLRYFGVTSGYEDSPDQTVTVVDTHTSTAHQLPVKVDQVDGKYSEVQVTFGGRPGQVVVAAGGQFRTYPLADVLAGRTPTATSSAPLGAGNHGPVVSRSGDRHYSTTADGVDGAALPGSRLTNPTSVPYSATRNVVANHRPRWAADDRTVWGSASEDTGLAPEQWADTRNVAHVLDTSTSRSTLTRLPDGVAGRLALSARYAAVTTLSPEGDVTTLLDADPRSASYRRVVGTVALPALARGPVAGRPTAGTQSRATALTPDGSHAIVTSGGAGRLILIDTARRAVVREVNAPTPLSGAHLTVVQHRSPVTDLVAR